MFFNSFSRYRNSVGDEEYLALVKFARSVGYDEVNLRRMDMYGFNRLLDQLSVQPSYVKWEPYFKMVSDLKEHVRDAHEVWIDRRADGADGCTHCHSPMDGRRYVFSDKVLCPLCYSAYRYIRPTLESCSDGLDIRVYGWKDWDTFEKDNPLDEGHWEYGCGVLLIVNGFEQKRVWHVRHPLVMRNLISAGIPM